MQVVLWCLSLGKTLHEGVADSTWKGKWLSDRESTEHLIAREVLGETSSEYRNQHRAKGKTHTPEEGQQSVKKWQNKVRKQHGVVVSS